MASTGFSTSSGIGGGDPGRDYYPRSESESTDDPNPDPAAQPTDKSVNNYSGGSGDRTQGAGRFGADDIQQPSSGDQYGSSGGYAARPGADASGPESLEGGLEEPEKDERRR